MSYADKAIDPVTGRIRSYAEVAEVELRAKTAARYAQIHAERETEAAKPELVKRIEHFQAEYDHARRNDEHARAKFYKSKLDLLKDQRAIEVAAEAKAKAFAKDQRIGLIREEADAIARSGRLLYPHSSQSALDESVAIARSDDWPDPESQYQAYREVMGRIEDQNLEAERIKTGDAEIEAARQELTVAESNVLTAQIQQARARREAVAE